MNSVLVKALAVALTLSQITTHPHDLKTHFDPSTSQAEVTQLLRQGCQQMIKTFGAEDIKPDEIENLLNFAVDFAKSKSKSEPQLLDGLSLDSLRLAYTELCVPESKDQRDDPVSPQLNLPAVIDLYDQAMSDLPRASDLTEDLLKKKLNQSTMILDGLGQRFSEIYDGDGRRKWVDLSQIPDFVQKAFVAAEDKRFYKHRGVDERGIIRAFLNDVTSTGRPEGGSTITQQVVKNLSVGNDLTFERKMREMVAASRAEEVMTKSQILEIYLNYIYLGRASWGVEMAAQSYFGKSIHDVSLAQAALLAAMTKGPNYYDPDRHMDRAKERRQYVLNRMREDGYITKAQFEKAQAEPIQLIAFEGPVQRKAFYYLDDVRREARDDAGIASLTTSSYVVKTTIRRKLQKDVELAVQEGLAEFELNHNRAKFSGPEKNIAPAIRQNSGDWQSALKDAYISLYDVAWPTAVVLSNDRHGVTVGLEDGRKLGLRAWDRSIGRSLKYGDVVFVYIENEGTKKEYASLRFRPKVQGAALVMNNHTGGILALTGGFSYPLSQFDRATQGFGRQPGSTIKPLTYLNALNAGLQPNTMVQDSPITLRSLYRRGKSWSPHDYEGNFMGPMTLRHGLEMSRNAVPAYLLKEIVPNDPSLSLDLVRALAREIGVYQNPVRFYPFILGAQGVRPIDLAKLYATIANEGFEPTPHFIESIQKDGQSVYQHPDDGLRQINLVDGVSFYQMKSLLQGVLIEGTAYKLKDISDFVGGKTGTTDGFTDAWFAGFTNDITIIVWVGYDNGKGKGRTSLGSGATGAGVAMPIFGDIVNASFVDYKKPEPLSPPSSRIAGKMRLEDVPNSKFKEWMRIGNGNQVAAAELPPADFDSRADDDGVIVLPADPDDLPDSPYGEPPPAPRVPRYVPPPAENSWDVNRPRRVDPQYPQWLYNGNGLY